MKGVLFFEICGEVYEDIANILHLNLQVFFHIQQVFLEKGDRALNLIERWLTSYSKGAGFGCEV
jgi:hypothetical protein